MGQRPEWLKFSCVCLAELPRLEDFERGLALADSTNAALE
jgi:hypothetical protein